MYVGFAKVAYRAKCLQILQNRFAAFAPRDFVVNVKLNARGERWTCATGTTGKSGHVEAHASEGEAKGLGLLYGGWLLHQAELRVIRRRFRWHS